MTTDKTETAPEVKKLRGMTPGMQFYDDAPFIEKETEEAAAEEEVESKPFEIALNNVSHWLSCLSQALVTGDKAALESAHLDLLAHHEELAMFYASPNTVLFNNQVLVPRADDQEILNDIAVSDFVKNHSTQSGQWLKAIGLHCLAETKELILTLHYVHRDGEPYSVSETLLQDTVERKYEPHVLTYTTGLEQHIDVLAIPHNFDSIEASLITVRDHYDHATFVQFYLTDENHPLDNDLFEDYDHFRLCDMHLEDQPSNRWIIDQMSTPYTNRELSLLVAWGVLYDYVASGDLVEAEFTYGEFNNRLLFANGLPV